MPTPAAASSTTQTGKEHRGLRGPTLPSPKLKRCFIWLYKSGWLTLNCENGGGVNATGLELPVAYIQGVASLPHIFHHLCAPGFNVAPGRAIPLLPRSRLIPSPSVFYIVFRINLHHVHKIHWNTKRVPSRKHPSPSPSSPPRASHREPQKHPIYPNTRKGLGKERRPSGSVPL